MLHFILMIPMRLNKNNLQKLIIIIMIFWNLITLVFEVIYNGQMDVRKHY